MKQTPAAPDYTSAAQATAASSRDVTEQQTWANRPTINTPFGQQTWDVTPTWDEATGQYLNSWEQNTNLTPEAQQALDSQMGLQQGRSDLAAGLLGRVQDEYGKPMDWSQFQEQASTPQTNDYNASNLPDWGKAPDQQNYNPEDIQKNLDTQGLQNVDPSQRYYDNAGDAIYNQFSSRNEPQFTRDTEALRTQLYNQGLREGDEAYDREVDKLRQSQNDARQQASYQATIGSGAEAQRMQGMDLGTREQQFGERAQGGAFANSAAQQSLAQQLGIGSQEFQQQQAGATFNDQQRQQAGQEQLAFGQNNFAEQMQAGNFQNQGRQQQIAEEMQKRGFSLNEIQALLSGQQVNLPNMPTFNTANASAATNYTGAARDQYGAAMDAYQAQQQQMQGLMQGASSAAMMFSDRRLKENIVRIGTGFRNLPIYLFNYLGCIPKSVGYMADEVAQVLPDAVHAHESGYMMVDYARLV